MMAMAIETDFYVQVSTYYGHYIKKRTQSQCYDAPGFCPAQYDKL